MSPALSTAWPGVDNLAQGDSVFGQARQTYASLCVVKAADLAKVPNRIDVIEMAALPTITTTGAQLAELAMRGRRRGIILVTGAVGGVGRSAVFVAKENGWTVVAAVRSRQMQEAETTGADRVIALDDPASLKSLEPVDAIADTISGSIADLLIGKVKDSGVFASAVAPPSSAAAHPSVIVETMQSKPSSGILTRLAEAVRAGRLVIPLGQRYALSDAIKAHRAAEKGAAGKLLLLPRRVGNGTEDRMQPDILTDPTGGDLWLVRHPVCNEDSVAVAALRSAVAPMKGKLAGTAGRGRFDDLMERVAVSAGVTFEPATFGGIDGWWAKPARAQKGAAIIHVHGGWFNWGTARAFRNFAGHIALSAGADAFIPDYRLAPEHPFPAAVRDLQACYRGLVGQGITRIALTGDSAGGNLALVLLSIASAQASDVVAPVGAVVFSPITDLALTGESFKTRADADLFFTKSQALRLILSYLGEADPKNALASPLYADLSGLPPIRVHVGDDEVLLDDSCRYVENAVAAGVNARLDLWMGMPHGFVSNVGGFIAASQVLTASGAFLTERLGKTSR